MIDQATLNKRVIFEEIRRLYYKFLEGVSDSIERNKVEIENLKQKHLLESEEACTNSLNKKMALIEQAKVIDNYSFWIDMSKTYLLHNKKEEALNCLLISAQRNLYNSSLFTNLAYVYSKFDYDGMAVPALEISLYFIESWHEYIKSLDENKWKELEIYFFEKFRAMKNLSLADTLHYLICKIVNKTYSTKEIEIREYYLKYYPYAIVTGIVYLLESEYENALKIFDRAVNMNKFHGFPLYCIGVIYQSKKEDVEAITYYSKAIDINPLNANYYYNRSSCLKAIGNTAAAIFDINAAISINPLNLDYYRQRKVLTLSENESFNRNKRNIGIEDLRRMLAIKPGDYDIRKEIAKEYKIKKAYDSAFYVYSDLVKFFPSNYEPYYLRGHLRFDYLNEHEKGIEDLTKAYELEPEKAHLMGERGYLKARMRRYEDALNDYDAAIKIDPANAFSQNGKLKCEFFLGRFEKVIETFLLINKSKYEYTELLYIGYSYYKTGDYKNAHLYLNKGLDSLYSLSYDSDVFIEYKLLFSRGLVLYSMGNEELAYEDFIKAKDIAYYNSSDNDYFKSSCKHWDEFIGSDNMPEDNDD